MKSKITSVAFYKAHGTGANTTYYHNINVDNETRTLNIGAKQQMPSWLAVGQELEWNWKDESKGSIVKAQKPFNRAGGNGWTAPNVDTTDLKISTGLICATMLYVNGKISNDRINEMAANVARKFDEIKAAL